MEEIHADLAVEVGKLVSDSLSSSSVRFASLKYLQCLSLPLASSWSPVSCNDVPAGVCLVVILQDR